MSFAFVLRSKTYRTNIPDTRKNRIYHYQWKDNSLTSVSFPNDTREPTCKGVASTIRKPTEIGDYLTRWSFFYSLFSTLFGIESKPLPHLFLSLLYQTLPNAVAFDMLNLWKEKFGFLNNRILLLSIACGLIKKPPDCSRYGLIL